MRTYTLSLLVWSFLFLVVTIVVVDLVEPETDNRSIVNGAPLSLVGCPRKDERLTKPHFFPLVVWAAGGWSEMVFVFYIESQDALPGKEFQV